MKKAQLSHLILLIMCSKGGYNPHSSQIVIRQLNKIKPVLLLF